MEIQRGYVVDGKVFDSKADAEAYLRRPMVEKALNSLNSNNTELTEWLLEHQDTVLESFDVGVITRVSKSEKSKLEKALGYIKELNDPKMAFVAENADAIYHSFRWPTVKRMTDEEKAVAVRNSLSSAAEGNESLINWVIENKDGILEAYNAAKPKREVSANASTGLALYREGQAIRKEYGDEAGDAFREAVKAKDESLIAALRNKYPV
jgi:hypothetical protein